jgi:hypothetical protein
MDKSDALRNIWEGIDPLIAYHLQNIKYSLMALQMDTDILEVRGTSSILMQAESAIDAVIKLAREQARVVEGDSPAT